MPSPKTSSATAAGGDMHLLSPAIQEFAEVRSQFDALHQLLGFDPAQTAVQMLERVDYGTVVARPNSHRS